MSTATQPTSRRAQRRQTPAAPRSASARAYLRNGLPAVYRETWHMPGVEAFYPAKANRAGEVDAFDDEDAKYAKQDADLNLAFAMRFLKALEEVLDPIVTLLDCLPAHLDPKLAPLNALHTMADWLGLPFEEHVPGDKRLSENERHERLKERQRRLVQNALEINRSRGTRRGLELLLELMFGEPDRPKNDWVFRVIDGGYCVVGSAPPAEAEGPEPGTFIVQWTQLLEPDVVQAVKHLVEREKPVNARCTYEEPKPALAQVEGEVKV
jgi:phage tail-like protein